MQSFSKFGFRAMSLVLIGVIVLLTACGIGGPGSSSPTSGKVSDEGVTEQASADNEITVWYFDKVSMETAIPLLKKAYPSLKVRFVQQPFGDMAKKYQAALAAKAGVPDVIGLDTSMVGRFLDAGENLMAAPYNAGQFRNDFVEWKFNAPVTPKGEMSAFPWDVATGVMFYRPDSFKAAGLPTEPEDVAKTLATWDDFIKAGQQMAQKSGGESYIIANAHDVFNAAFWQAGGNIVAGSEIQLVKEGSNAMKLAITASDAKIGANIATWSERWIPSLKSGKVASMVMGGWMLGNLENLIDKNGAGNWRLTAPPGGAFNNGGTYLQIPKLAKNKQAAWEFVKFVTTNADTQNAIFAKTGIVPAYKPAWDSPLYDEPVAYLGGQRAWRLMVDLAQQVRPLYYSSVDSLGTDLLNAQVDAAIAGRVPADDALMKAATQLQERAARVSNVNLTIGKSKAE
ncbi:MAG: extracellular solute-binding protein [Chloroflexi bacterium]|nr:extracellular solute-binding protein [Chloroflexota bacterium]